jgi:hypothetical protein
MRLKDIKDDIDIFEAKQKREPRHFQEFLRILKVMFASLLSITLCDITTKYTLLRYCMRIFLFLLLTAHSINMLSFLDISYQNVIFNFKYP